MGRCLFIPSVCLWLLPQDLAVSSIFLLLKSLYPSQWPWPGPKRTRHWTSFHTATSAPRETHTHHMWPGQPHHSSLYPVAAGCLRFLRHESSVFPLGSASFTSLGLRGKPWTPALPTPLYLVGGPRGTHSTAAALSKKYPYQSSPPRPLLISLLWLRGPSVMGPVYRHCLGNLLWVIRYLIRIACTLEPSQNFHFNMH